MSELAEINEILRLAGLPLLEEVRLDEAPPSAKRLLPMFQGILQVNPRTQEPISRKIEWARRVLEREDRIIWYLRLIQAAYFVEFTQDERLSKQANKKLDQIAAKMGMDRNTLANHAGSVDRYEQQLTHFLSMPINNIQRYVFDAQSPDEIMNAFKQAEDDWKEDQDRTVPEDPDSEVVMDFGDGYAWYNLNKAYCSNEADAMGHCGNSPRMNSNDTILSLRRRQKIGGEDILTPVLTFILKDDGQLTEMKGRGNDKPAARYHKYIVPLLRSDVVNGITGGGYMPENNFSLSDLEDDELADELRDEKPGLAGPTYWIEKAWEAGDYEGAAKALEELVDGHSLDYPGHMKFDLSNAEEGMYKVDVELGEWDSYEDVAREYDDTPVEELFKLRDELESALADAGSLDAALEPGLMVDMFEMLPEEQLSQMAQELGIRDSHPAKAIAAQIAAQGENHRYYDMVREAVSRTLDSDAAGAQVKKLIEQVNERLAIYADTGYRLRPWNIWAHPRNNEDELGPWVLTVGMQDLMNMVEAGAQGDAEDYDNEDYYNFMDWRGEGIRVDHDGDESSWRGEYSDYAEHKLAAGYGEHDDMWNEIDVDELESVEGLASNASQALSQMLSTGMTPAMDTSRQGELPFEAELRRIRQLAGIL